MKKAPAKMKKGPMKAKMAMTTVNGKKVPAFAADGKKAAMKLKKQSAMMMKKSAMEMKKASAMKMKMKKKK